MPKVSVIVPVYHVEEYLRRCLDSLLAQTYDDYEVVCINDCSPDHSQQILEEYADKYPDRMSVYVNEHNLGLGKTRERGLTLVKGEYVMFIDSDDYVKADFIETYMSAMEAHPCDAVVGGFIRDIDGKLTEHKITDSVWGVVTYASVCTKMFRKSFIDAHQIEFTDISCGEDIYFSLCAFYHGLRYYIMEDYAGYYYYYNRKSITGAMNYEKNHEQIMAGLFERLMQECDFSKISQKRRWVLEYTYMANMVNALVTFGHGGRVKRMKKKYEFFMKDLSKRFPDYRKNPYFGIFRPKGQTLKIRLGVGVTMALHRIHLDRLMFYAISLI